MSGALLFGYKNMVVLNTSRTFFLDSFLRPYLKKINLDEKIFYHYDSYDGFIDFSELTIDQYMQCYRVLKKAFEYDLKNLSENKIDSDMWAVKLWFREIKPAMQSGTLFCSELSGDETPYEEPSSE